MGLRLNVEALREVAAYLRAFPLGRSLLRREAEMKTSGGGEMLTCEISFACFTGAAAETLAILADEEVDDVLIAVVAVGHAVLTEDGCRLNKEVGSFSAFGGFGKLFGVD